MKKQILLAGLCLHMAPAFSLSLDTRASEADIKNSLLPGASIKSIEGLTNHQIATFENLLLRGANGTQTVLDKGIVLSTGTLENLPTSNTLANYGSDMGAKGDAIIDAFPLLKANSKTSADAALIRFSFDAPEGVNGVRARFVYVSEEFPNFAGSMFADGFAFSRNETVNNVKTDVNYALLANHHPVSLFDQSSTIHFMSNGNAQDASVPQVADLEFNGITPVLQVSAPVVAGQKEDFTLVIADTGDHLYDSAVFFMGLEFFNIPGFDFSQGTVILEDNPAFQPYSNPQVPLVVPVPGAGFLMLSGLAALLGKKRCTCSNK